MHLVGYNENMEKYFILDTNVLIHNPQALYSFAEHYVILPITVIEELDKFKNFSDKKGMHARHALREIDSVVKKGALKKGAKLSNGGRLLITLGRNAEAAADLPIDLSLNDNKILATAYAYQKEGKQVFFISKDVNARIRAEAIGVQSQDYEKQKVEYSSLYAGWREITLPREDINLLYQNHSLPNKQNLKFFANEYILIKCNDGTSTSALCRYEVATNTIVPIRDGLEAMGISPKNLQQKFAFDMLLNDDIKLITLVGQAGTGKTLLALACGLIRTIGRDPLYEKMLVARPIIPFAGRDIGYLPGDKDEKLAYWMQPIFDNLQFIMGPNRNERLEVKDGYTSKAKDKIQYLMDSGLLEVEALTYIRGRSIPHQFIIIDESQNLTPHEIKTIVSRAGENTKIVLTGDPEQIDNPYLDANSNGLAYTVELMKGQKLFGHMLLSKSERSELAALAAEIL